MSNSNNLNRPSQFINSRFSLRLRRPRFLDLLLLFNTEFGYVPIMAENQNQMAMLSDIPHNTQSQTRSQHQIQNALPSIGSNYGANRNPDVSDNNDLNNNINNSNFNYPILSPLPHSTPIQPHDDVLIYPHSLMYKNQDLFGERARVMMWDEKNEVWAIRLGKTGEIIGAKKENLWKIRQVKLEDLDLELPSNDLESDNSDSKWMVIAGSERNPPEKTGNSDVNELSKNYQLQERLLDLPKGVEVKIDMETGRKLVRKSPTSDNHREEM